MGWTRARLRLDKKESRRIAFQLMLLVGLVAASTYAPAILTGGPTDATPLVAAGLCAVVFMWVIRRHVLEKAAVRQRLQSVSDELARQHEFLGELSPLDRLQDCLEFVVQATAQRLRCRRVSVMLPDADNNTLRIVAARGVPEEIVKATRLPIGTGVAGEVFLARRPLRVDPAGAAEGSAHLASLADDPHAFLCAPVMLSGLRWGRTALGVLSATGPIDRDRFSDDDEAAFTAIAGAAAVAIYNHMTQASLRKSQVAFLNTMANVIEARDPYTRGHSDRVCRYALAIGKSVGLNEAALQNLEAAAKLHDIGKLAVPDSILGKPGPLAAAEFSAVQKHTQVGARMLAQSALAPAAVQAIRYHHERLNGSGYPDSLSGPEIPLIARIISVADCFDALTSPRVYRKPLSLEAALDILETQARENILDPLCVATLCTLIQNGLDISVAPLPAESPLVPG
ncbi:MAG: HD domain-containing protein [Planctomycetota bacterium]|nr:HD domain-containing protein [Planctomycetota bacterium]